jgi:hypothetical protein
MPVALSPASHEALSTYADIERQAVMTGRRTDPERKPELVRLRRKLSEQIGVVGLLLARDGDLARTPEKHQEMNRLFTTMRYALGRHQANWPAVQIDGDFEGYARSAKDAYAKADQFWDWCRDNIGISRPVI